MVSTPFSEPYRHWVIDGLVDSDRLRSAARAVPSKDWPSWIHYDSPFESRKRTCEDMGLLPPAIAEVLHELQSVETVGLLTAITRVPRLECDPTLRGAGVHVTDAGGFLDCHLDYAKHPEFDELERRLNLVLFLDEDWQADWRGELVLYGDDGVTEVKSIAPEFGRAVLFECSDLSYHGVPVVACPEGKARRTIAVYYLAPARPGVVRKRALFVPNRRSR